MADELISDFARARGIDIETATAVIERVCAGNLDILDQHSIQSEAL